MPSQHPEVDELRRRPLRYWDVDGLPEVVMGALWLVWGLALWLPILLPAGRWLTWYWTAVPLLLVLGGVGANRILVRLKYRLTFRRTGYVAMPEPSSRRRGASALLAAVVAAGLAMVAFKGRTGALQALAAPGCGVLIAGALLVPVVRSRLRHYLILSAASLALAVVVLLLRLDLDRGMIVLLVGIGLASLGVGAVRLRTFVRSHPVPAEDETP